MRLFKCPYCGGYEIFTKRVNMHVGVYCADCGTWIKWVDKKELRLAERQIKSIKPQVKTKKVCGKKKKGKAKKAQPKSNPKTIQVNIEL